MKRVVIVGALCLLALGCERNKSQKSGTEPGDKSGVVDETEQTTTGDQGDETEEEVGDEASEEE